MSSIFKKIKSVFVVEESSGSSHSPLAPASTEPPEQQTSVPPTILNMPAGDDAHQPSDDRFAEILWKALEKNNQEGFDYFEFKLAIRNLLKLNMVEETAFRSAFATAQTMGSTPEALLRSAEHYLSVLQIENTKFDTAWQNQYSRQVENGRAAVEAHQKAIEEKKAKLQALEEEIKSMEESITGMMAETEDAEARIVGAKRDFVATHRHLVSQIESDIENIRRYLK